MAGVEVTISGVIWDKQLKAGRPVTIIGEAILTGLGVGGGPIIPPEGGGGSPPSIWPSPGHPAHPIAPGGPPPGIWPSPGPLPHPEHPIVMPDPPPEPVQPPIEWKAVWHPEHGWIVVGVPNFEHPAPAE